MRERRSEQAKQWRAERASSETESLLDAEGGVALREVATRDVPAGTPNTNGKAVPAGTPPADQGQNAAVNEELLKALAKANGGTTTAGTCNNSCHCAIA